MLILWLRIWSDTCMCQYIINISPNSSCNGVTRFFTGEFQINMFCPSLERPHHMHFHQPTGYKVYCSYVGAQFFIHSAKISVLHTGFLRQYLLWFDDKNMYSIIYISFHCIFIPSLILASKILQTVIGLCLYRQWMSQTAWASVYINRKSASLFLLKHNRLWIIACSPWSNFQRTKRNKVFGVWTERQTDIGC